MTARPTDGRLVHFTPLRYPGGKGKLAAYVKSIIDQNEIYDGEYVEPFAGGAAIALELLFHEYVRAIRINDLSRPVNAFWSAVLEHTDELCAKIRDTDISVENWDRQKSIVKNCHQETDVDVGFATFFLNRTNRSGILNGGIIGGRDQSGPWKIDARYNVPELINRIRKIADLAGKIHLTSMDAVDFLKTNSSAWGDCTLVYMDPPYYVKGRQLYLDYYKGDDHKALADAIVSYGSAHNWIVSYDNVEPIRHIYRDFRFITYDIGYSARENRQGSEVMFFSDNTLMPELVGPLHETERSAA